MNLRVTDREFDTILAALRYWRRRDDDRMPESEIAAEHGKPLSDVEIDALCERINW